jgi:hypothetical protein
MLVDDVEESGGGGVCRSYEKCAVKSLLLRAVSLRLDIGTTDNLLVIQSEDVSIP